MAPHLRRVRRALAVAGLGAVLLAAGCATSSGSSSGKGGRLAVVAAENVWGSLATQLGGDRVTVTSVISSPSADPHAYEPTAADARAVARADLTIVNGVGYDGWASKLLAANPSSHRKDLDVGRLVGVADRGNPHRWYSPADVRTVVDALTAQLTALDPAGASYFTSRRTTLLDVAMKPYFDAIDAIRAEYAGTPVGASESLFAPLAEALGLKLLTPTSFLDAITAGTDPTARDKATIDGQIAHRAIRAYVYNTQNATPDVQAQVQAADRAGVETVRMTETLTPAGATFQQWQVAQLTALRTALARGTAH